MYKFFLAHIYVDLHMNEEALVIYEDFQKAGLHNSTYIKAQMVLVAHNQKGNRAQAPALAV